MEFKVISIIIIIFALILIYILSAYIGYKDVQKNHSIGGKYNRLKPDNNDFLFTFCPVMNTLISSFILIDRFNDKHSLKFNYCKIFKIKGE